MPRDTSLTRRSFLAQASATALAGLRAAHAQTSRSTPRNRFLDLLRTPDEVVAYSRMDDPVPLARAASEWRGGAFSIDTAATDQQLTITVSSPAVALKYVHLRWRLPVDVDLLALGDAWERSYGDLGWRNLIPERVMPWYFATWDGAACHCYGVKTGAGALCFWQLDPEGVSLWLNTANGGDGVLLGERRLPAATVVTRRGQSGEDTTAAIHAFCRQMCAQPTRPVAPVYGTNDWYYAYGHNTAQQILADTEFIAGLAHGNAVPSFSVVDMGWRPQDQPDIATKFPSMPRLAERIKAEGVRPGIWIRPLEALPGADPRLLLPDARFGERRERTRELAFDPTIPEAREQILSKAKQVVEWRYELVKHDFSTYDLLGSWGFEMGAEPTAPGWSLHDRSRTNAEVILELYRGIRDACGAQTIVLGCNTVGHLGQGLFDAQRTGDDTSGKLWERTRRMGVNTLAFRLPQHGAFFVQDADCVGISAAVPWEMNRQWLDLLAHSGTTVFISPGEGSRTPEQAQAIRQAFALAAAGGAHARPATTLDESTPERWVAGDTTQAGGATASSPRELRYEWSGSGGAYPFSI